MKIRKFIKKIYARIWIVILLPLVAGIFSAGISFFLLEKEYESSTTVYLINKAPDGKTTLAYDDLLVAGMLVNDYKELIGSVAVSEEVIEQLGLKDIKPKELAKKISISAYNDTRIIEIKVKYTSPVLARNIADMVRDVSINKALQIMRVENINLVDKAVVPDKPVSPRPFINIAFAVFTGGFAAMGIIFLIEYIDNIVRITKDVEKL